MFPGWKQVAVLFLLQCDWTMKEHSSYFEQVIIVFAVIVSPDGKRAKRWAKQKRREKKVMHAHTHSIEGLTCRTWLNDVWFLHSNISLHTELNVYLTSLCERQRRDSRKTLFLSDTFPPTRSACTRSSMLGVVAVASSSVSTSVLVFLWDVACFHLAAGLCVRWIRPSCCCQLLRSSLITIITANTGVLFMKIASWEWAAA